MSTGSSRMETRRAVHVWEQVKPRTGEKPRLPVHQITIASASAATGTDSDLLRLLVQAEHMAHARGLTRVGDALLDAIEALEGRRA